MKAIAIAVTMALFPTFAAAQMQCGPYETLPEYLEQAHDATIAHSAYSQAEAGVVIIEIYTAEDGTWIMVMVQPDGTACILGNGGGWNDEAGGEPV